MAAPDPALSPALAVAPGTDALQRVEGPGLADAGDSARFAALMEAPATADPMPATPAVSGVATTEGRTLGDNILGGLQRLSNDLQQSWANVGDALSHMGAQPSVHDMLAVQMHLSTMSVQYELVSKAVSRSTQNIDQLVKLQ